MSKHRGMPSWEPLSGMNLTPLINVVFVLLMVAFVITPAMSGPPAPPSARSAIVIDSVGVTVGIDYAGGIWLNDGARWESSKPADLAGRLARAFEGQDPDARVLYLHAEPRTPYRSISPVLHAAREAGIRRMGLLAVRPRD